MLARLTLAFCIWKLVLLLIAGASPAPGYDTSTYILLRSYPSPSSTPASWLDSWALKLTRWDAIYFTTASYRGPLFEQNWAFSRTFTLLTSHVARVFPFSPSSSAIIPHAVAGILLSHLSHYTAVVLLYHLTYDLIPSRPERKHRCAFTAASLHILSPAGLFLAAPYGESAFVMTNFAASYCYIIAKQKRGDRGVDQVIKTACTTVAAGVLFGIASTIRSNGLLNGFIFAWDAVLYIPHLPTILRRRDWGELLQLMGTLLGGLMIAVGYVLPQLEAYRQYCTGDNFRPWCNNLVPSVYSFVQKHYWNVGFMRYWTLSNLPLFALAAPVLTLLMCTGWAALNKRQLAHLIDCVTADGKQQPQPKTARSHGEILFRHVVPRLAIPQVVLALLAFTSFHVQIINRISSGYPLWYIMLAIAVTTSTTPTKADASNSILCLLTRLAPWIIRASVMYAIIQAGLYASFLPPA